MSTNVHTCGLFRKAGLAMAFVALMGTRGLAELKRKYDPEPETDEGAA